MTAKQKNKDDSPNESRSDHAAGTAAAFNGTSVLGHDGNGLENDFLPVAVADQERDHDNGDGLGHGQRVESLEPLLEPLPYGPHFSEREAVYKGNFVAMMLEAVAQMPQHYGDLTRACVEGTEPVTVAELAEQFQIARTTVVVHLSRGAKKSLDKKAIAACELLYLLVHWHRSRRREGCTLEFLEAQYRWLHDITQHPNLVEYAIQYVARKVEFGPAKLGLLSLDNGASYLTVASLKTYQTTLSEVVRMVRQCAFMHMAQQEIEYCVFAYLDKKGFRDLSVAMLNEAFAGLVMAYDSPNPKVLAVGTSADAYTLAALLQSDVPLSISQIHEVVLQRYGIDLLSHRISKSGKDNFLTFRAGVFGLESHFQMPSYVRQRTQSAAIMVLKELGKGTSVDDDVLVRHVNARLQSPVNTPEGLMPPVSPVNRYEMALALRGMQGIQQVGTRQYRLAPQGEPVVSAYSVRDKVANWIAQHQEPISLEKVREIAPEIEQLKNGYALSSDDVLVRIGHGIFWLRALSLPNGVLFDLEANGFEPVSGSAPAVSQV